MSSNRSVAASVLRTLAFHCTTFVFACFLGLVFCMSGSALFLLLGCLIVGSTHFSQRFTHFLWRTEMRIDALVREDQEDVVPEPHQAEPSREEQRLHGEAAALAQLRRRRYAPPVDELTVPVMLVSLLYFLVFKWIMDLVFSVVPLALWIVSIAQLLPASSPLADAGVDFVATANVATQIFMALAFAFLAHQLGLTSARGLLLVSNKVYEWCFTEYNSDQERAREGTNNYSLGMIRPPDAPTQLPGLPGVQDPSYDYGTMRNGKQPKSAATRTSESSRETSIGGSAPYVSPMMPPMPPLPRFPNAERAFRSEVGEQEFQLCGWKVSLKPDEGRSAQGDTHNDIRRGGVGRGGGRGQSTRRGFGCGRGGGWGGPGFSHMGPDHRGSFPFPMPDGPSPWSYWRERGFGAWGNWPGMPDDARFKKKTRRQMHRRNSFDGVVAVAVPVTTTDEESDGRYRPEHMNVLDALDLKQPSAPPLPSSARLPRGSDESLDSPHALRPHRGRRYAPSMHKSRSEGDRRFRRYYSNNDDSGEDEGGGVEWRTAGRGEDLRFWSDELRRRAEENQRRFDQQRRFDEQRHSGWEQRYRRGATSDGGEVTGENDEWSGRTGAMADDVTKSRQWKRAERKQERKQRHMDRKHQRHDKYEEKLRLKRGKSGERRHEEGAVRQEMLFQAGERERFAREIDHAADEAVRMQPVHLDRNLSAPPHRAVSTISSPSRQASIHSRSTPLLQLQATPASARAQPRAPSVPTEDPRKRAFSSRRARPGIQTDHQERSRSNGSYDADRVEPRGRDGARSISVAAPSQASVSHDISDLEIHRSVSHSYDENDVTNLRYFGSPSLGDGPPELVTRIDTGPRYRGSLDQPDYDNFSPMGSPRSFSSSGRDLMPGYDALSPTNSLSHDADFSTDTFQQVYRSIQSAATLEPRHFEPEEGGLDTATSGFEAGMAGRRDRVNFSAFAPPSVCPSPRPFQFTVWAFLLNQRLEMQERAETEHPDARKLSLESKLDVRRGALVHVTLEVPSGFRVLNEATQGFVWESKLSNVCYDVECTEGAAFGRVLFKARVTVGASVAVLRSYVLVGSRALEPAELEAQVLESSLEVMEKKYREIPYKSLELKELVGQGYFGDAYRASLPGQGGDVVVKTIRASEFGETTEQIVREFQHEAAMLSMFGHHPCIVPFVGASTDTRFPLALVTEYLPYGSLEKNLKRDTDRMLSVDQRTSMLKDAAAGLLNIHEGGFIHRDLAARNCLVDDGLRVRICDFGLCRRVQCLSDEAGCGMLMKDAVGPVKYMAPESLQPPHAFSYDSDVYMFGVLMWETYTHSAPFASLTPVETITHVLRGERLPVPTDLPLSLQTIMESCFHDSPAERPSMQDVVIALGDSLAGSQQASAAIAAAARAIATAGATSLTSQTSSSRLRDRSIFV